MSQITKFIADVFDIYPNSEFVKFFILNKKLDVASMLEHPLLVASMTYGYVWNAVYNTFPTRKDFAEFFDRVLNSNPNIPQQEIIKLAKQTIFLANSKEIPPPNITAKAYLYSKWSYRYNTPITNAANINLYTLYTDITSKYDYSKSFTYIPKLAPNLISLTEEDLKYMTSLEQTQFHLYKDLHFLLKLLNHVVVFQTPDFQLPQHVFAGLVDAHKDPILLLNAYKLDHDEDFSFDVSPDLLIIFPKIARTFILVSESSLPTIAPILQSIIVSNKSNTVFPGYDRVISAKLDYNSVAYPILLETPEELKTSFKRYLTCKQFYNKYWNAHLNSGCPIRSNNVQFGMLAYWKFLYYYTFNLDATAEAKTLGTFTSSKTIEKPIENIAVLVDNRENVTSVLSVLFALKNLPKSWGCKIYTSAQGLKYYKQELESYNVDVIEWKPINVARFHIDVYNSCLKDENFWKDINSKRTLIIQDDGLLLRPGIEKYLDWDYIGCPWVDCEENRDIKINYIPNLVGNGGFSARNTSMSAYICEKYKTEKKHVFYKRLVEIPEDVYFGWCMTKEGAKIPTAQEAEGFGSEQIIKALPLGIHKVWAYNMPVDVKKLFGSFLS